MWSHSDGPVLLFWWSRFQKTTGLNWVIWLRPSQLSLAFWRRPYFSFSFWKLKTARWCVKTNYRSISSTVLAIDLFIQNQSFCYASITIMPKSVIRKSQALFHFLRFVNISFDGVNFESTGSSEYAHGYTLGLANYKGLGLIEREKCFHMLWNPVQGQAMTTGCNKLEGECALKTEFMDMSTLQWSNGPDYPFSSE